MKRILTAIFVYIAFVTPAYAIITPEEATSYQYIQNHGYSAEMSRLIDLQQVQINNTKSNYKNNDPEWYTKDKKANFIRRVFIYFDCGLDDGKFMQHDINYSTKWDNL